MKEEEKDNGGRAQVNIRRNSLSAQLANSGESQGATGLQVLSRMGMNQQKRTLQVQGKLSAALSVSTPSPHSSMHVKLFLRDIQEPPGSLETQALAVGETAASLSQVLPLYDGRRGRCRRSKTRRENRKLPREAGCSGDATHRGLSFI